MADSPSVRSLPDPERVADDAARVARVERRKLVDEQQAFEQFADEIEGVPANRPTDARRFPLDQQSATGLRRVCEAYRDTVMSVPHYREEYDEPLRTNLAEELGGEIAAALTEGDRLYPHVKTALLEVASEAVARRAELIETIDREAHAVEGARERIVEVHGELTSLLDQPLDRAEYNTLRTTRERLLDLRSTCEGIVAERQEQLREHTRAVSADVEDFGQYLYGDEGTIHPLIAHLTEVLAAIDRAVSRVEDRLMAAR